MPACVMPVCVISTRAMPLCVMLICIISLALCLHAHFVYLLYFFALRLLTFCLCLMSIHFLPVLVFHHLRYAYVRYSSLHFVYLRYALRYVCLFALCLLSLYLMALCLSITRQLVAVQQVV